MSHPDFEREQAYIERAWSQLDKARQGAEVLHDMVESGRGGTHQARYERDVISEQVNSRLEDLDIGDQSLVFGRIDLEETGEAFHIGRVAVFSDHHDPIVVDWRAPIAEPFYRATGPQPMGLSLRRHFASRGRELLGIEDEFFGENAGATVTGRLKGEQTLIINLEEGRTGRLGDIVGTVQAEQDEIIRSKLPGILLVQGGPGTGKTVVALHRAAYLLYTHRFPLAGQGVLVIGPNRLFLTYIEQVLPSLGESGVELAVLGDFVPGARVQGRDTQRISRIKGDLGMAPLIARAVRDRQRPLREDLVIGHGLTRLRVSVDKSKAIIKRARSKAMNHNHGRKFVEHELFKALARSSRYDTDLEELKEVLAHTFPIREALAWMWPRLTPAHLLHDLYGSRALLRSAGGGSFDNATLDLLHRPRTRAADVVWTADDVPLLDEAYEVLGPRWRADAEVRTYGHIVIDEAQDLSPMELRSVSRRSLNGSMTVVGDIAQATSAWAASTWDDILRHLPDKPNRMTELSVGYRLPAPTMALAGHVLERAVPGLKPPVAVRSVGIDPRFVAWGADGFAHTLVDQVRSEIGAIGRGNVAIITPDRHLDAVVRACDAAGLTVGVTYGGALERQVSVIAVSMVKGLEIDAALVVDPDAIVEDEPQPWKSLYVAVTRATKRLTLLHPGPDVPESLRLSPDRLPGSESVTNE